MTNCLQFWIIGHFKPFIKDTGLKSHQQSLVIFKPFIKDIFQIINNQLSFHALKIRLLKDECKTHTHNIQCGVIAIPNNIFNTNKNGFSNKYDLLHMLQRVIQNNNNKVKFKHDDCKLSNIIKQTSVHKVFKQFETYYIQNSQHWCSIGKNKNENFASNNQFGKNRDNYNSRNSRQSRDVIDVCIESVKSERLDIHQKVYNLFFMKNGQIIAENANEPGLRNGKMVLDFKNFEYLYAISSIRCDCAVNPRGSAYEVVECGFEK